MLARCPYPDCGKTFEAGEPLPRAGSCQACGRDATLRSDERFALLERNAAMLRAAPEALRVQPETRRGHPGLTALLEDIRSLWNVGSMFRTADGAGFSRVYLCGITGYPPRKEITKTALGADEHVPWEYCIGALDVVPELKRQGVQMIGLERTEGSRPLTELLASLQIHTPLCLAVGNEVTGLSRELLSACDVVGHLPMRGVKESLNAAVAFGVAAYLLSEVFVHPEDYKTTPGAGEAELPRME